MIIKTNKGEINFNGGMQIFIGDDYWNDLNTKGWTRYIKINKIKQDISVETSKEMKKGFIKISKVPNQLRYAEGRVSVKDSIQKGLKNINSNSMNSVISRIFLFSVASNINVYTEFKKLYTESKTKNLIKGSFLVHKSWINSQWDDAAIKNDPVSQITVKSGKPSFKEYEKLMKLNAGLNQDLIKFKEWSKFIDSKKSKRKTKKRKSNKKSKRKKKR